MRKFLSAPDDLIQKAVDAAAFFLMRRLGWEKAFLRRSLWHVIAASWTVYAMFITEQPDHFPKAVCVAANVILAAAYVAVRELQYRPDGRTGWRSSGAILSPVDAARAPMVWIWKLWSAGLAWDALFYRHVLAANDAAHRANHRVDAACILVMAAAFLLEAYLVKTPDTPPPLAERGRTLVPAPAGARR